MKIFGILNITEDSFSDGGMFLDYEKSIQKGKELIDSGADVIDIGAQSSNIESNQISPELEWERIKDQIQYFHSLSISVSVDTYKFHVIRNCIKNGVDYINNITSFKQDDTLQLLLDNKDKLPKLILMYSHNQSDKASFHSNLSLENITDTILKFFEKKINSFLKMGIPEEKLIIDPGMGFFLGSDPYLSIRILKDIKIFKKHFKEIMVSVSKKSFIGNLLGNVSPPEREAGTLACELYLYLNQIDYIRTHNVKQLKDGIVLTKALYY